jgi:hypothetical protein
VSSIVEPQMGEQPVIDVGPRVLLLLGGCCLSIVTVACQAAYGQQESNEDYLGPELRERVERLKTEARHPSEDPAVLEDRLDTLWDWANAYSLVGPPLPVDFTYNYTITKMALVQPSSTPVNLTRAAELIARHTREFQIYDENPRAVGPVTLSEPGPFIAGDTITVEQTYTVGTMPMVPGGGVMVGFGWYQAAGMEIQARDPAADGYVTIRSSNPDARFEATGPWGQWYTFHNTQPQVCFRLQEGTLTEGDTITLTYGDRSEGSQGVTLQTWAVDKVELRLSVDLEGQGVILTPVWPSFRVVGRREARGVNAVARPSIVEPGKAFELAVKSEDEFRNPISGPSPEYDILLDGEIVGSVPAGSDAVAFVRDLSLPGPGVYRFLVRSKGGSLACRSNPIWVTKDPAYRLYWGDTHGHTSMADGQGSGKGYYEFGRDVARLDFLVLSEHDVWLDASEWNRLLELAATYDTPGSFSAMLGYEWTMKAQMGGHHNVYFPTLTQRRPVRVTEAHSPDDLYRSLRALYEPEEVLIIPHAHAPGDWRTNDPEMERVVEISSQHGTFEWFGNKYLQHGARVGFIGSSDNHNGQPSYLGFTGQFPGLAAVMADENTVPALFKALKARSCYATTGERIVLQATLNGEPMGRLLSDSEVRRIRCRAMGTEPIEAIDVIRNGEVVYTRRYLQGEVEPDARVQVMLASSSEVFSTPRNPRRAREWTGSIEVRGARLAAVQEPWFQNPLTPEYGVTRDAARPNRLIVNESTRGRGKGILLELGGASPSTEIVVDIDAPADRGRRRGQQTANEPAPIEPMNISLRLGDLTSRPVVRDQQVGQHTDSLTVQLVPPDAALDQLFEYSDQHAPGPDDYYYVRVRQVDGSMAWSSPWWVGSSEGS